MSLFSANNRVSLTASGHVTDSPSIQVDSNLRRWFARNLGVWRSRRQYLFSDDQVMHLDMNLKMEALQSRRRARLVTGSAGGPRLASRMNSLRVSPGMNAKG